MNFRVEITLKDDESLLIFSGQVLALGAHIHIPNLPISVFLEVKLDCSLRRQKRNLTCVWRPV